MYQIVFRLVLFGHLFFSDVWGHGRMIDPPSRASMWRYGFNTPHNNDDHGLNCGGFSRQWDQNKGKCGICGDAWDRKPRPHEAGGTYANNIIVRRYRSGDVIPVQIELTANHRGYFEFRLCPVQQRGVEVDQECLDKYLLIGREGTRFYPGAGNKIFENDYALPAGLTCEQCVLQWRYVAGNSWGTCENGTGALGCGRQEEFRACADIAIVDDKTRQPPRPIISVTSAAPNATSVTKNIDSSSKKPTTTEPTSTATESSSVPEETDSYWLFTLIIAITCLMVILAVLALIYVYYYHAGKAKQWLMAGKLLTPESPPVAPPRQRKNHNSLPHSPLEV